MPSVSKRIREFSWRWLCLYIFLYIPTLSFDFSLLWNPMSWYGGAFQQLAAFTGKLLFGVTLTGEHEFYSDSLLVYIHLFNLVVISFLAALFWTWRTKKEFTSTQMFPVLLIVTRYFLALMLFMYGFNKIFKYQFYLPEPNTLFQTVGNTPRDLLYWTSMGTSYTYSVFMGVIEVIPAFLLLFRRTALMGAVIALLVMINVVFVNLGFDITVKIHSITLCIMSAVLILPAGKKLLAFFSGKSTEAWSYPALAWKPKNRFVLPLIKTAVIFLILAEANYTYFQSGNFNDDKAERPYMHGAYEVVEKNFYYYIDTTTGPEQFLDDPEHLKYVFVHRKGYIIFQYEDGHVQDYQVLYADSTKQRIRFTADPSSGFYWDIAWDYRECDSTIIFLYTEADELHRQFKAKKLDLSTLPLLQEEFGWIDEN